MYKLPKVSIVIPVYNGANYMREAIDSALAQTYDNIEIIVVNDGSCDEGKTDEIARGYGERIRYFTKENGGCASALNLGISKMNGEYFLWLSHDDVYMPEKIEHQINALHTSNSLDTIIYGGYELIDSQSKSLGFVKPDSKIPEDKRNIPLFSLLRDLVHGCSLLIPTKYFRKIGVFDETLLCTQDYALWFEFLRVAPIHFDSRILIKSRTHREENVDVPEILQDLLDTLNKLAQEYDMPIIVSTHPSTRQRLEALGAKDLDPRIQFLKPFGFLDYIKLQMEAFCILSDSGSITEDASLLNLPAVTIRNSHERPEGMDEGVLIMSGLKAEGVMDAVRVVTSRAKDVGYRRRLVTDYDAGLVSTKVLNIVMSYVDYVNRVVWFK